MIAAHPMDGSVEVRFVECAASRFAVRIAGAGRPLVALHSMLSDSRFWTEILAPTLASDVRLIAPDARGHGQSAISSDDLDYPVPRLAEDVIGVVNQLGIERFALIGFSMGARVAARISAEHPEKVAALGVFAPPPASMEMEGPRRFIRIANRIDQVGLDTALSEVEKNSAAMAKMMRAMPRRGLAALLRGVHNESFVPSPVELAKIRCPTVVLGLENDPHPLETARLYADSIPGASFSATTWSKRESELRKMADQVLAIARF